MKLLRFIARTAKEILRRLFGVQFTSQSETSKVRSMVLRWCVGKGCDIGFGGDKIVKQNCDGIDLPQPYTFTGRDKVDIPCDVINGEIPVADNTYDYVYTSHLIEDFANTKSALQKFIRILKNEGTLILVFPDQKIYEDICRKLNQVINPHHIHADMGYDYMIAKLNELENVRYQLLFSSNCDIDYNVVMALRIFKQAA